MEIAGIGMLLAPEAVRVEEDDGEIDSQLFSPPTDVTFTPVTETTSEQEAHHTITPWERMDPEVLVA